MIKKIYAYIKGTWSVYGGNDTKVSSKANNIVEDLSRQTNTNEDGIYVPLSKKSGNVIDKLTGQATDINNGLFVGKSAKTDNALQKITGSTNSSEDGLYVEDLNPKINRLDLTAKLNKYGTQEYFMLGGLKNSTETPNISLSTGAIYDLLYLMRNEKLNTTIDDTTRFNFSTNGTTNTTGSYVVLKAGITYSIELMILGSNSGSYYVFDENGKQLGNRGFTGASNYSDIGVNTIVKFDKDTKIYFKYKLDFASVLYSGCSYIKIESMEYLAIDPLQYVDNTNGTQDTPVGTIINVMGKTAPKHYLSCDGTEYQIKDYPYLAQYFKEQFGATNYFGGDGVTTFRTPDLRGEFLRGTGTNGHANQGSGSDVGIHQDATEIPMFAYNDASFGFKSKAGVNGGVSNVDSNVNISSDRYVYSGNGLFGIDTTAWCQNQALQGTVRPTNTSILYCIKAEPTYFINVIGTTTETELFNTPTLLPVGTEIKLNDSYTNYDKLKLVWKHNNIALGDLYMQSMEYDVKDLVINNTSATGIGSLAIYSICLGSPNTFSASIINIKDSTTLEVITNNTVSGWGGNKLEKIIGIKTSSVVQGGSFGTGRI